MVAEARATRKSRGKREEVALDYAGREGGGKKKGERFGKKRLLSYLNQRRNGTRTEGETNNRKTTPSKTWPQ